MPTICFRTSSGKKVSFKARVSKAAAAKKACPKKRKGTWPKGKVPKHLRKYLFR